MLKINAQFWINNKLPHSARTFLLHGSIVLTPIPDCTRMGAMMQLSAPGLLCRSGVKTNPRLTTCATFRQRPEVQPGHSHKRPKTTPASSLRSEAPVSRCLPAKSGMHLSGSDQPCKYLSFKPQAFAAPLPTSLQRPAF